MSDGTVVFGKSTSAGSRCASRAIQQFQRPNLWLDVPWTMHDRRRYFKEWVERNKIKTLNVAGNRESVNPGIGQAVCEFLIEVLI